MNIEQFAESVAACRYCFMCRHLAPLANVTYRESDTPRGRALIASYALQEKTVPECDDYIEAFFRADLSGANRFHCVNHYDEVGIVLAMRADIAAAGRAPAAVQAYAAKLMQADYPVRGTGDTLYIESGDKKFDDAMKKLLGPCATLADAEAFKALKVLGFVQAAETSFQKFKAAAGGFKNIIAGSDAVYDALKNDFPGIPCTSAVGALLKLGLKAAKSPAGLLLLPGDFLKNYDGELAEYAKLNAALGLRVGDFGTNGEESYSAGEGAVVMAELYPELAAKLAAKIAAETPVGATLLCGSAYTARALRTAGVGVVTYPELCIA